MPAQAQLGKETAEVKRLKACINDLIGVVALPAIWSGGEPPHIANTLADVLLDTLDLDLVCVGLRDAAGEMRIEVVRAAQSQSPIAAQQDISEVLSQLFDNESHKWPQQLHRRIGGADVSIVPLQLGLHGEIGMIVAIVRRMDFPLQTERLVLNIAATQAAVGLQEARLLAEQKRVASELDQRVKQRTADLSATNEELRREIAERKLAEFERQRLASIVEGSNDFVAITDLAGRPLYVNLAGQRMVGLASLGQSRRIPPIASFFDEGGACVAELIKNVVAGDGAWSGEMRFRHLETEKSIPVLCHVFRIDYPEIMRPSNLAIVCRDVSELKHAEVNAQAAQAELARVNRLTTMGEMAASIAHEINQPLTAIVANGEACLHLLRRKSLDRGELRAALASMIDDARRAAEITVSVRKMVKRAGSEWKRLNINEVIETVLSLARREMTSHEIYLKIDLRPLLPLVSGDVVQLQQVLLNLIMNAIEAMTTPMDRPRTLAVRSEARHGGVYVAVTDSGPGIDPAIIDSIFDPFFTTKSTGTGLGLSICRSIIDDHGGRLWSEPAKPHGSTFQFSLPSEGLQTLS